MAATQTALSACPAFAMAMGLRQRSHTSIGASTTGSYRSRPSSPAGLTMCADPTKPGDPTNPARKQARPGQHAPSRRHDEPFRLTRSMTRLPSLLGFRTFGWRSTALSSAWSGFADARRCTQIVRLCAGHADLPIRRTQCITADLCTLSYGGRVRSVTAARSDPHLSRLRLPGSSSSRRCSPMARSLAEAADRSASAGAAADAPAALALDAAVEGVRRDQDRYRGRCATARRPGCSRLPGGRAAARACP